MSATTIVSDAIVLDILNQSALTSLIFVARPRYIHLTHIDIEREHRY